MRSLYQLPTDIRFLIRSDCAPLDLHRLHV